MKLTFNAKVVVDTEDEPTYQEMITLLEQGKCSIEFVPPWGSENEPTLIITEKTNGES